ncbi:MAG: nitroreductase [Firmicutes bacterium]|nr:nitroreductase [Bacillota bacterium]
MIREDLASRWYNAIFSRHSVRAYDGSSVPSGMQDEIGQLLDGFSPMCKGARAVLLEGGSSEILAGFMGVFGKISGADLVLALIGDASYPNHEVAVGFLGEGIILHATSLGLGTCWVSGTYSRKAVEARIELGESEKVMAVSPIGFAEKPGNEMEENSMKAPGGLHKRKPLESLVRGLPMKDWPPGFRNILEAARLAPSAVNRQPWRFTVKSDRILVSAARFELLPMAARKLDCGIAMLHLEAASGASGIHGEWSLLDTPPGVAEYIIRHRLRRRDS